MCSRRADEEKNSVGLRPYNPSHLKLAHHVSAGVSMRAADTSASQRARYRVAALLAVFSLVLIPVSWTFDTHRSVAKPPPPGGPSLPIDGIPDALRVAMDRLDESAVGPRVNLQTWDGERQKVIVHHVGPADGLASAVGEFLPEGSFALQRDRFSRAELVAAAERLARHVHAAGIDIVAVRVDPDNGGIRLELAEVEPVEPAVAKQVAVLTGETRFPVTVTYGNAKFNAASGAADDESFSDGARTHRK